MTAPNISSLLPSFHYRSPSTISDRKYYIHHTPARVKLPTTGYLVATTRLRAWRRKREHKFMDTEHGGLGNGYNTVILLPSSVSRVHVKLGPIYAATGYRAGHGWMYLFGSGCKLHLHQPLQGIWVIPSHCWTRWTYTQWKEI
jgi:hypothetical protein